MRVFGKGKRGSGSIEHELMMTDVAVRTNWKWIRGANLPYQADAMVKSDRLEESYIEADTGHMSMRQIKKRIEVYSGDQEVIYVCHTESRMETLMKWTSDLGDRVSFLVLDWLKENHNGLVIVDHIGNRYTTTGEEKSYPPY